MPVFSLKRILDETGSPPYRRIIWLLLEAVRLHPVQASAIDNEPFQKQIQNIQRRLQEAESKEEMLVAVGLMNQTLEKYRDLVSAVVQRQEAELQHIAGMLTKSLMTIGTASERSTKSLESIEVHLRRAKDACDFQEIRLKLEECLTVIHVEADRQKTETQQTIDDLKKKLGDTHLKLVARSLPMENDSVTGLPQRRAAENAISEAVEHAESGYILVCVLSILNSINARFGRAAGDELFTQIATMLSSELSTKAILFRWTGPTILSIFNKRETLESIRSVMGKILRSPKMKSLSYFQETTFINISINWTVVPLTPPLGDTIRAIDQFAESQTVARQPSPS